MKKGMDRYAFQKRFKQKGYFRKYSNRSTLETACKASSSDSLLGCTQSEKEEIEEHYEVIREEKSPETYCEGRQGISLADSGRCQIEEENLEIKNGEEKVKEKKTLKHKKHEAKESKAFEKKEDKKEGKKKK